ncbi:LeoA/HP0731 family dynamin-like GTPase [Endozoicomonas ascidiicola]|uniref:LeoA/HP0731 family dynamin-like GTPase n=1 Tax=Endozoicomonas ascidiicola TaxID=1698521 RepID=UPI00082BF2E0|nr:LeoA/HP0731 family dynamin-like GTPase [Endozoicomonas ascidiicola]
MNSTIEYFESEKIKAKNLLKSLTDFLSQGEEAGITIDSSLKEKLVNASESIEEGTLKVALIGGFSEGKTSIAAAWMKKLDKSSMNISQQESSNEVKVYQVGSDCVLIDTPGLFGFKEQYNEDTRSIEKYKDITKKYVSEAHLVLYVMNSTNPIKSSHKDDLQWLFRQLNLLPRTVFVLSRFDEVADVEDDYDYDSHFKIKKNNVTERLNDSIQLTQQEKDELSIVAVSANPFDMGTDYWLNNLDKFKKLSHIGQLQSATNEKLLRSGGQMAIAIESAGSVVRDVLHTQMPIAIELNDKLGEELSRMKDMTRRLDSQLKAASGQISEVKIGLREFSVKYFSDLILQTKGLELNTFSDFFEREIGSEGVIIEARLQNEFERHLSGVTMEMARIRADFDSEVNHYNSAISQLGKQGLTYLRNSSLISNTSVIAARDGIISVAGTLGMDLSKMLKFKPWGAVNLAKGINGALVFIGIALEAWDSWQERKRQEEFRKSISQMVKNFEQQREDILRIINSDDFSTQFFPDYLSLQEDSQTLLNSIDELNGQRKKFVAWRDMGDAIEAEYRSV